MNRMMMIMAMTTLGITILAVVSGVVGAWFGDGDLVVARDCWDWGQICLPQGNR